jgi:hypothetical protein
MSPFLFPAVLALSLAQAPAVAPTPPAPTPAPAAAPAAGFCAQTPAGMACVDSGSDVDGVTLSPFYLDEKAATGADLKACVAAKACAALPAPKDPAAPLVLGWRHAERLCAFMGKRLPTAWELDKARATAAWKGDEALWSDTWKVAAKCADATCTGKDPLGPCDGAFFCPGSLLKVAVTPAAPTPTKWTPLGLLAPGRTTTVRCALSTPALTRFPPARLAAKREPPPLPTQATPEQEKTLTEIEQDKLDTQVCEKKGRSFIDCRDPNHYIRTNEPAQAVWTPYIENVGGGYAGVGIDQNYSFMALARSQWAWLFDYDPTVVRLHHVLRAIILEAPDRAGFVAFFKPENAKKALEVIEKAYATDPEMKAFKEVYTVSRAAVLESYLLKMKPGKGGAAPFGWLGAEDRYAYIRAMYQAGRVAILKGNMLADKTMQGIAASARKLGVTLAIYYPSNAPECWPNTKQYKDNVRALPFDEQSVVLQTISGEKEVFGQHGHWHYNVQSGLQQQSLMALPGYTLTKQLIFHRQLTNENELSVTGLPSN